MGLKKLFLLFALCFVALGVHAQTQPLQPINSRYLGIGAGGGTADAQTVTYTPATTAYTAFQVVSWLPTHTNATTTPTLNVDGIGPITIIKTNGSAVIAGDISTTNVAMAMYDGTAFELLNPQNTYSGGTPTNAPGLGTDANGNLIATTPSGTSPGPYIAPQAVSGCGIDWTGLLNFTVGACHYIINGVPYTSAATNLTDSAADPSNPRIDVIFVDTSGVPQFLDGTPAGSPATPVTDPSTQLVLEPGVLVNANGTTPANITSTIIYDENDEWTAAAGGTSSAHVNVASTNNPYHGTYDVEFGSGGTVATTTYVSFTDPASGTIQLGSFNFLVFYLRNKAAWPAKRSITAQWFNGATPEGTPIVLSSGSYGLNTTTNTTTYQQVSIPLSVFGIPNTNVTTLRFTVTGTGAALTGFYLDLASVQSGLSAPLTPSTLMNWRGTYSAAVQYNPNDVVVLNGLYYVALVANLNVPVSTSTTWAGLNSVPAALTGQVLTASNGAAPAFLSSGVSARAVATGTDTILCDNTTTLRDRAGWVLYTDASGATVTVPDVGATGCANNFVFSVGAGHGAGTITFNRTTASEFFVLNGSTAATGATSFTLTAGQYATVKTDADGTDWDVTITQASASGLSGMTATQVPIAATASTVTSSKAIQGSDTNLLSSGTVSGTGASLCTDASGGATTSGCASGGVTSLTGDGILINNSASTGAVRLSKPNTSPGIVYAGPAIVPGSGASFVQGVQGVNSASSNLVVTASITPTAGDSLIVYGVCRNTGAGITTSGFTVADGGDTFVKDYAFGLAFVGYSMLAHTLSTAGGALTVTLTVTQAGVTACGGTSHSLSVMVLEYTPITDYDTRGGNVYGGGNINTTTTANNDLLLTFGTTDDSAGLTRFTVTTPSFTRRFYLTSLPASESLAVYDSGAATTGTYGSYWLYNPQAADADAETFAFKTAGSQPTAQASFRTIVPSDLPSIPYIIYHSDQTGQVAAISDTLMASSGNSVTMFRFTGTVNCTTTSASATATLNLKYTDTGSTAQTVSVTDTCTSLVTSGIPNLVVGLKPKIGTAITWGVTIANTPTYDVSVRLEQE